MHTKSAGHVTFVYLQDCKVPVVKGNHNLRIRSQPHWVLKFNIVPRCPLFVGKRLREIIEDIGK